jgi:hypothetical protein
MGKSNDLNPQRWQRSRFYLVLGNFLLKTPKNRAILVGLFRGYAYGTWRDRRAVSGRLLGVLIAIEDPVGACELLRRPLIP